MDSFHSPLLRPPLQTGRLPLLSDNNGDQRILISSSNNSFLNNIDDDDDDEDGGGGGSDDSADDVGGHEYIAVAASSADRRSCGIVADDNNANDDGAGGGGVRRGCFGDSSNVVYDSSDDSARVANPATVRQHNKFTLATPSKTIRTRCSKTICWQFLASVIYTLLYVSTSPCLAAKQEGKYAYTHIPKFILYEYLNTYTPLLYLNFRNSYTSIDK